ncbi:hypothetical protein MTO96_034594 [Rhipicephalus appendiculatus]
MNIGASHRPLDAGNILPHPTTVARKVEELAANARWQLMPEILSAINESRCAITADTWADDYRKIFYTSATAHYIDDKWKLHSHVLFTCDFPNEKKSGVNVRRELLRRFAKLGVCSDALAKAIFVTDQGANIICALQPYDRLNSGAHLLNMVLPNTFAEEFIAEEVTSTHENLQNVKCLVNFLKQSGLASQLSSGVIQEVPTR